MPRVIAMDYGQKRTGVAVTDELQLIASGLKTVPTPEIFSFLDLYLKDEKVELFVVGEPKQMNYSASESEKLIRPFVEKLKNKYNLPVIRIDERFTSKMAGQSMVESGLKKKKRQNKALLDEISATLILQSYLYQKNLNS